MKRKKIPIQRHIVNVNDQFKLFAFDGARDFLSTFFNFFYYYAYVLLHVCNVVQPFGQQSI